MRALAGENVGVGAVASVDGIVEPAAVENVAGRRAGDDLRVAVEGLVNQVEEAVLVELQRAAVQP
jgi:hypothetical protein